MKKQSVKLSGKRRALMHRTMDGDTDLSGTMFILNSYVNCDHFLEWLIEHRYTGKNLRDILVKKFRSSVPALIQYIIEDCRSHDARKIT